MIIKIRFDAAPSNEGGAFIEVENEAGESIEIGEWIPDAESTDWFLVINTDPHDRYENERTMRVGAQQDYFKLKAKLEAHLENKGEHCPLCALEEANEALQNQLEEQKTVYAVSYGCPKCGTQMQQLGGSP